MHHQGRDRPRPLAAIGHLAHMLSMRFDEGHESPDLIDRRGEPRQAGGGGGGWFFLVSLLLRTRYGWVILLLLGGYYLFTQVGGVTHDTSRSADGVHETTQQTRDE